MIVVQPDCSVAAAAVAVAVANVAVAAVVRIAVAALKPTASVASAALPRTRQPSASVGSIHRCHTVRRRNINQGTNVLRGYSCDLLLMRNTYACKVTALNFVPVGEAFPWPQRPWCDSAGAAARKDSRSRPSAPPNCFGVAAAAAAVETRSSTRSRCSRCCCRRRWSPAAAVVSILVTAEHAVAVAEAAAA